MNVIGYRRMLSVKEIVLVVFHAESWASEGKDHRNNLSSQIANCKHGLPHLTEDGSEVAFVNFSKK